MLEAKKEDLIKDYAALNGINTVEATKIYKTAVSSGYISENSKMGDTYVSVAPKGYSLLHKRAKLPIGRFKAFMDEYIHVSSTIAVLIALFSLMIAIISLLYKRN